MKFTRITSYAVILVLMLSLFPASGFAGQAVPDNAASAIVSNENPEVPDSSGDSQVSDDSGNLQYPESPENPGLPDNSGSTGSSDTDLSPDNAQSSIILEIKELPQEAAVQKIEIGSGTEPVLPAALSVRLENEEDFSELPVQWTCDPAFDKDKCGTYIYSPQLPDGYSLAEGLSLPQIKVQVVKAKTTIKGLTLKHKVKSRSKLTDKITVSPALGRTVRLQLQSKGKWVTKKTYTLKQRNSDSLTMEYTKDWWKLPSSSWRVVVSESEEADRFTSSIITITAKRYYQNPSKYIQIKDEIKLKHSSGYNLGLGHMGLRVRKVNSYFHMGNRYFPRYTNETQSKVRAFQKKRGLKATGNVNLATWRAMGFSQNSWYTLGAYVSPIKVNPSSTRKDHVEAMISTAKKYLGSDYIVGASGKPKEGADCSGLVMQGLYAAGVDPYPVSCLRHSKPGYEYESRNLWANKKFKSVPYTQKQRGDLVFYRSRAGAIIHVAIYLGNGKVIESWPNKVVIWPIKNSHRDRIAGIKRVFV